MRVLWFLVLALTACKPNNDGEGDPQQEAAAELQARRQTVERLIGEAQPRVKAFGKMLDAVDSLPPPADRAFASLLSPFV